MVSQIDKDIDIGISNGRIVSLLLDATETEKTTLCFRLKNSEKCRRRFLHLSAFFRQIHCKVI